MFDEKTCSLMVPSADGRPPSLLPLRKIYEAENRISEVATVNGHKAPELLATFNIAYLEAKSTVVRLHLFLADAEKALNLRKAIVILDIVPKLLEEKNVSNAKDYRDAVLAQDAEYVKCQDRVSIIEAMVELIKSKEVGIEWAFTSVKKILGADNNWQDINKNRNLGAPVQHAPLDPNSPRNRFGGG